MRIAYGNDLVITHGNGPQIGLDEVQAILAGTAGTTISDPVRTF